MENVSLLSSKKYLSLILSQLEQKSKRVFVSSVIHVDTRRRITDLRIFSATARRTGKITCDSRVIKDSERGGSRIGNKEERREQKDTPSLEPRTGPPLTLD